MAPKSVIALMGTIGSGKDFAAEYMMKNHGFKMIGMGDVIREEVTMRGLEHTRDNITVVSREYTDKYGMDYWAKKVVDKINELGWERALINGVRRLPDVETPKNAFGDKFHLILIDADPKIRFERMKSRDRPGDPQTLEEFKRQEKSEIKLYETFEEAIQLAEYTVKNNGTAEELFAQIDEVMGKLLGD